MTGDKKAMVKPTRKLIESKVAKILNNRELVINRGSDHGVEQGMKFKIMGSEVIRDPDTDEELGLIEREVIRVKAVDVQPRFAVAQTYQTYQIGSDFAQRTAQSIETALATLARPVTKVRTIRTDKSASELTTDAWAFVQVSDGVIELGEDEM